MCSDVGLEGKEERTPLFLNAGLLTPGTFVFGNLYTPVLILLFAFPLSALL